MIVFMLIVWPSASDVRLDTLYLGEQQEAQGRGMPRRKNQKEQRITKRKTTKFNGRRRRRKERKNYWSGGDPP